jgi:putative addiction module CopG family antidote
MPRTVTVELSEEHARWIDDRVADGDYPDAAAAVREGLDHLRDQADELPGVSALTDHELRDAVQPGLDRLKAGHDHLLTADEVFGRARARYLARHDAK